MSVLPARGTPIWVITLLLAPLLLPNRWVRLGSALGAGAAMSFFRDPERTPAGEGFAAAADGLVREVSQEEDGRWTVSTYLSLRDVHVTRAPEAATVLRRVYFPGAHHMAFGDLSHTNERMEWTLDTAHGPMRLVQYSGAVARRIVPYERAGAALARGQRIGLIRFGSRVDVTLPPGVLPVVVLHDRVRAGRTLVGTVEPR
jgi:phosphatidylserine decarboxylase